MHALIITILLFIGGSSAANAHEWDYWNSPQWGAGFYDDANFSDDWFFDYYEPIYSESWFHAPDRQPASTEGSFLSPPPSTEGVFGPHWRESWF